MDRNSSDCFPMSQGRRASINTLGQFITSLPVVKVQNPVTDAVSCVPLTSHGKVAW